MLPFEIDIWCFICGALCVQPQFVAVKEQKYADFHILFSENLGYFRIFHSSIRVPSNEQVINDVVPRLYMMQHIFMDRK